MSQRVKCYGCSWSPSAETDHVEETRSHVLFAEYCTAKQPSHDIPGLTTAKRWILCRVEFCFTVSTNYHKTQWTCHTWNRWFKVLTLLSFSTFHFPDSSDLSVHSWQVYRLVDLESNMICICVCRDGGTHSVTDKPEFYSSDISQCVFTVLAQSFHAVGCQESLFSSELHESLFYSLK